MLYALFYMPPCGKWYVHSHKLFLSTELARDAAKRFLSAGTPYVILPINLATLGEAAVSL